MPARMTGSTVALAGVLGLTLLSAGYFSWASKPTAERPLGQDSQLTSQLGDLKQRLGALERRPAVREREVRIVDESHAEPPDAARDPVQRRALSAITPEESRARSDEWRARLTERVRSEPNDVKWQNQIVIALVCRRGAKLPQKWATSSHADSVVG